MSQKCHELPVRRKDKPDVVTLRSPFISQFQNCAAFASDVRGGKCCGLIRKRANIGAENRIAA
jgi:hypothetical protein